MQRLFLTTALSTILLCSTSQASLRFGPQDLAERPASVTVVDRDDSPGFSSPSSSEETLRTGGASTSPSNAYTTPPSPLGFIVEIDDKASQLIPISPATAKDRSIQENALLAEIEKRRDATNNSHKDYMWMYGAYKNITNSPFAHPETIARAHLGLAEMHYLGLGKKESDPYQARTHLSKLLSLKGIYEDTRAEAMLNLAIMDFKGEGRSQASISLAKARLNHVAENKDADEHTRRKASLILMRIDLSDQLASEKEEDAIADLKDFDRLVSAALLNLNLDKPRDLETAHKELEKIAGNKDILTMARKQAIKQLIEIYKTGNAVIRKNTDIAKDLYFGIINDSTFPAIDRLTAMLNSLSIIQFVDNNTKLANHILTKIVQSSSAPGSLQSKALSFRGINEMESEDPKIRAKAAETFKKVLTIKGANKEDLAYASRMLEKYNAAPVASSSSSSS